MIKTIESKLISDHSLIAFFYRQPDFYITESEFVYAAVFLKNLNGLSQVSNVSLVYLNLISMAFRQFSLFYCLLDFVFYGADNKEKDSM